MTLINNSSTSIQSAELQFNLNSFGLMPESVNLGPYPIPPNDIRNTVIPVVLSQGHLIDNNSAPQQISPTVQMGIQLAPLPLILFSSPVKFYTILQRGGVNEQIYGPAMKELYESSPNISVSDANIPHARSIEQCLDLLQQHGMVVTNKVTPPDLLVFQVYGVTQGIRADFVAELIFPTSGASVGSLRATIRARPLGFSQMISEQISTLCGA